MQRVLLISNVPQPYRTALFNAIDRRLKMQNIHFKVVFAAEGYKRRKATIDFSEMKFDYQILDSMKVSMGNVEKTMFTYKGIGKLVSTFQPDKIIVLGFSLATLKIFTRSFFKRIPFIIWSGAVESPGRYDSFFRKLERKALIKKADAFIAYGTKAKEYLVKMGAPAEKVFIGINTVDTTFFAEETDKARLQIRPDQKKHLLYIGYLVPRKEVDKIIELASELSAVRNDFVIDIVGDGSERAALERLATENKLGDLVRFHGFKQKQELPPFLAQSSCFLFQTGFDIWGLVLNEAMAAGLPSLSSVNAAATKDLIVEGQTGFAVDFNDKQNVINKINLLLDHPNLVETIGNRARDFILSNATIEKSADGFVKSLMI